MIFDDSFKNGFIAAWVFSLILVVAGFIIYAILKAEDNKVKLAMPNTGLLMIRRQNKMKESLHMNNLPTSQVKREEFKGCVPRSYISTLETFVPSMSFEELARATNNFGEENIISLGRTGRMYKAVVGSSDQLLAVKRFYYLAPFDKSFTAEINTLGRLKHRNLVPLLGFCIKGEDRFLVYKYMPNGCLHDWLHPPQGKAVSLEWPLSSRIGLKLAKTIAWLHHNCEFPIIHGNLSTKCILLDRNFEPKISNFRGATIMKSNNATSDGSRFTSELKTDASKKDVYCFGILLLEMIIGEKHESFSGISIKWIARLMNASAQSDDDKSLPREGFDREIFLFLKLANKCIKPRLKDRPTMVEVYGILKSIVASRYAEKDKNPN